MSDPPSEDGRRSSDAASRLAALLSDLSGEPTPAPEPSEPDPAPPADDERAPAEDEGPPTVAFDLRALDRLLADAEAPAAPGAEVPAIAVPEAAPRPTGLPPLPATARTGSGRPAADALPPLPSVARPAPEPEADADVPPPAAPTVPITAPAEPPGGDGDEPVRLPRLTLRVVAFAVAFLVLAAAVPALGYVGARRLEHSQAGDVIEGSNDPSEEGYRVNVQPTPTSLVVHRDPDGVPLSATLLALGSGTTGGTVLQVPLSTNVREQRYYVDRLSVAYSAGEDIELFFREVEDRLGVDIQERIDLTDGQLAELVSPVAPLTVSSPDAVLTDDGREFPAGDVSLAGADVGPFLRGNAGEDELARLVRNEAVWTAWLDAVGAAPEQSVGSATTTGIGPFLRTLAAGTQTDPVTTRVETLDVGPPLTSDLEDPSLVPGEGFQTQIIDAVPFPLSPRLGRRFSLKLLNGVDGEPLPQQLLHDLILAGASLAQMGNANRFGRDTTTIEISGRPWQEAAEAARFVLGDSAEITTMTKARADAEGADIVITIGADVLDRLREEGDGG